CRAAHACCDRPEPPRCCRSPWLFEPELVPVLTLWPLRPEASGRARARLGEPQGRLGAGHGFCCRWRVAPSVSVTVAMRPQGKSSGQASTMAPSAVTLAAGAADTSPLIWLR